MLHATDDIYDKLCVQIFVEYGEGSTVSTIGDVYSLGILLLEMFTGRSPTDDMFGDTMDLHTYVEHALSEGILNIVDSTIWLHVESKDSNIRSRMKDCLVSVFRLAISCSKKHPRDRMLVRDASAEMHTIREIHTTCFPGSLRSQELQPITREMIDMPFFYM